MGAVPSSIAQYIPPPGYDPNDYSGRYNTRLGAEQEQSYQRWVAEESERQNRDISKDTYDYDLRGLWLEGEGFDADSGHAQDKYKKPNHPTFSDQSKYHGKDGNTGGRWSERDGVVTYTASKSNKMGKQQLKRYFAEVEPGVVLEFED